MWKLRGVFSVCELTLAVCKDYFSVPQLLALLDCLPEGHMQPLVVRRHHRLGLNAEPAAPPSALTRLVVVVQVCTMFSRIVDLQNFDRVLRKLAPDLAKDVRGHSPGSAAGLGGLRMVNARALVAAGR